MYTEQSLVALAIFASLQHCRFTSCLEFQFWYTWNKERRCGVEKKPNMIYHNKLHANYRNWTFVFGLLIDVFQFFFLGGRGRVKHAFEESSSVFEIMGRRLSFMST